MKTRTWTRSPRGQFLGVATGLAEWRDLPAQPVRLIIFFTILFTGFFPGAVIYLIAALILPAQKPSDIISDDDTFSYKKYKSSNERNSNNYRREAQDAEYRDANYKSNEELKREYEELKRKVEEMESSMFDKEKDWEERFNEDK